VCAVLFARGLPPIISLAVNRGELVQRSILVHADGWDALDRILAAHRKGVEHLEEVPGPNASLRIETRGREILFSRRRDGAVLGQGRIVRDDEVEALCQALDIARSEAVQ